MSGGAKVAEEQQHDQRGQHRADDEVFLDALDRGFDELALVTHDAHLVSGRQRSARAPRAASFTPFTIATVFMPDCFRICSSTVGSPLTLARVPASAMPSSMRATSRTSTGCPATSRTTTSPNSAGDSRRPRVRIVIDCAPCSIRPPGTSLFCAWRARETSLTVRRLREQPLRVEPHVELALASSEDQHLTDALGALELPPQHLVRVLGDVAQRLVGRQRDGEHRLGVGIPLLDGRLGDRSRQQRQDAVDLVSHLLRGDIRIFLQR